MYGLDLLNQTTANKGPYWYHHDGLGSVSDITSASGTPLWWAEYQPYGLVRASGSTSQAPVNPFMFTGQYQDGPTGLYDLRARQYDPTTGRFLAVDPATASVTSPYVSSYAYVGDDPTSQVDPSGKDNPLCLALIAALVEGGPVDVAVAIGCLGVSALVGYAAIQSQQAAQNYLRQWPLQPNGTLQEPPLVNVGPPLPPASRGKCTPTGALLICITAAGTITYWFITQANAPHPEPGPPPVPPATPIPVPRPAIGHNQK